MTDITAYSLELNGINQYVYIPWNDAYDLGTQDFTVEAWLKPLNVGKGGPIFTSMGASTDTGTGWGLFLNDDSTLTFYTFDRGDYFNAITQEKTSVYDGSWHHVSVVRTKQLIQFYFDGLPLTSIMNLNAGEVNVTNNLPLTIGATALIGKQKEQPCFKGLLDEVRIWKIALEHWQIDQGIYHIMAANKPNLIGQWGFDDKTADDTSAIGNNGRLINKAIFGEPGFYFVPEGQPFVVVQSSMMQDYSWKANRNGEHAEQTSYRVSIQLRDADGAQRDGNVKIWSDKPATISHQGQEYAIDETDPASLDTNVLKQINIAIPTQSLLAPVLKIQADFMGKNNRIVVPVDRQVHHKMSQITGSELINGNQPLLDTSQYNPEQAEGIAKTIRNVMSAAAQHDIQPQDSIVRNVDSSITPKFHLTTRRVIRRAVNIDQPEQEHHLPVEMPCPNFESKSDLIKCHYLGEDAQLERYLIPYFMPDKHFEYHFKHKTFNRLSVDDAVTRLAQVQLANATAESEAVSSSIDELWNHFVNGVLDVVHIVVSVGGQIAHGVTTVITYIENGVEKVFNFVVTTVEKAVDFVIGIFKQIGVALEKLIHFLRELFEWDDVLIAHRVINHFLFQSGKYAEDCIDDIKEMADGFFKNLEGKVEEAFDKVIPLFSDKTINTMAQPGNLHPPGNIRGQYLNQRLHEQGLDATLQTSHTPSNKHVNAAITALENVQSDLDTVQSQSGEKIKAYLGDGSSFMNKVMVELLEGIKAGIITSLKVINAVLDAMLDMFKQGLSMVNEMLNTQIDIPFFTWLYEKVITNDGSKLTANDLISLLGAVPATVTIKLIDGKAPFTQKFAEEFSQTTYHDWGFMKLPSQWGNNTQRRLLMANATGDSNDGSEPPEWIRYISYAQGFVFAGAAAIWFAQAAEVDRANDIFAADVKTNVKYLVAAQFVAQIVSYPLANDSSIDKPVFVEQMIWLSQFLPLASDLITLVGVVEGNPGNKMRFFVEELSPGFAGAYGIVHCSSFIYLSSREYESPSSGLPHGTWLIKTLTNVVSTLPEIGQLITYIPAYSKVQILIDLFAFGFIPLFTFIRILFAFGNHEVLRPR